LRARYVTRLWCWRSSSTSLSTA